MRKDEQMGVTPDTEILVVLSPSEAAALRDLLVNAVRCVAAWRPSEMEHVYALCLYLNDSLPHGKVDISPLHELTQDSTAAAA
jgi:hypothetical protein